MNQLLSIMLSVFLLLPTAGLAQEESPSKRINKIKRAGTYLYAEATSKTEEEAKDAAKALLLVEISEYVASKKKLAGADQVIVKDVQAAHQFISMNRGEMVRVFVYVKKNDVEPVQNVATITKEEMKAAIPPSKDTMTSTHTSVNKEPAAIRKVNVTDASLSGWQKELIEEICKQTSWLKFKMALNKYKAQYRVKRVGGNGKPCPTPSKAFYAFFDADDNLVALLGPKGGDGRINFFTGENASLQDFVGNSCLWFTLPK